MDLLNRFTLIQFLDILPDGVLSTLSNQSQLVNDLIYYDTKSTNKISKYLNIKNLFENIPPYNIDVAFNRFIIISYLEGPMSLDSKISFSPLYGRGEFSSSEIKLLANAITYNNKITLLNLSNNSIEQEGFQYLANMLMKNNNIQELILNDVNMNSDNIQILSEGIINNNSLKSIKTVSYTHLTLPTTPYV